MRRPSNRIDISLALRVVVHEIPLFQHQRQTRKVMVGNHHHAAEGSIGGTGRLGGMVGCAHWDAHGNNDDSDDAPPRFLFIPAATCIYILDTFGRGVIARRLDCL